MTQVRKEYLRMIVVHQWNNNRGVLSEFPEFHPLGKNATLVEFKARSLTLLKQLTQERFEQIRNAAGTWLFEHDPTTVKQMLAEYDAIPRGYMGMPPTRHTYV